MTVIEESPASFLECHLKSSSTSRMGHMLLETIGQSRFQVSRSETDVVVPGMAIEFRMFPVEDRVGRSFLPRYRICFPEQA